MDYKYEFEKLLEMADQAINAVNFDTRNVKTFAELMSLKNAVDFYRKPPNKVVEDEQAICTRDPGTCIKCQGLGCDEWCDDFPPAT